MSWAFPSPCEGCPFSPSQSVCASPCSWRTFGNVQHKWFPQCLTGDELGRLRRLKMNCKWLFQYEALEKSVFRFANTSWGQRGHEKRWRLARCKILGFDMLITAFNLKKKINVFKSFKTLALVICLCLDTKMSSIFYQKLWTISFSKARKCKRMHLNKIKAPKKKKEIFFHLCENYESPFFVCFLQQIHALKTFVMQVFWSCSIAVWVCSINITICLVKANVANVCQRFCICNTDLQLLLAAPWLFTLLWYPFVWNECLCCGYH